jgi:tetratricopeptide (TPR) repeat protein
MRALAASCRQCEARALFAAGRLDDTRDRLKQLVALFDGDRYPATRARLTGAKASLAQIYLVTGTATQAAEVMSPIVALDPASLPWLVREAWCGAITTYAAGLLDTGDMQEALNCLDRLLDNAQRAEISLRFAAPATSLKVRAYASIGYQENAIAIHQAFRSLASGSDDPMIATALLVSQAAVIEAVMQRDGIEAALSQLREALADSPSIPELKWNDPRTAPLISLYLSEAGLVVATSAEAVLQTLEEVVEKLRPVRSNPDLLPLLAKAELVRILALSALKRPKEADRAYTTLEQVVANDTRVEVVAARLMGASMRAGALIDLADYRGAVRASDDVITASMEIQVSQARIAETLAMQSKVLALVKLNEFEEVSQVAKAIVERLESANQFSAVTLIDALVQAADYIEGIDVSASGELYDAIDRRIGDHVDPALLGPYTESVVNRCKRLIQLGGMTDVATLVQAVIDKTATSAPRESIFTLGQIADTLAAMNPNTNAVMRLLLEAILARSEGVTDGDSQMMRVTALFEFARLQEGLDDVPAALATLEQLIREFASHEEESIVDLVAGARQALIDFAALDDSSAPSSPPNS